MTLDDLQQQWLAHELRLERRLDELARTNRQLHLAMELKAPRSYLRWSQAGDLLEMLLGVPFIAWTGSFLGTHFAEMRFWLPALALHAWFVATFAVATARFARKATIQYDAPVLEIQRQLEKLRMFALRALRLLFVSGVIVWSVPFPIVSARSWFGLDLYALLGGQALLGWLAVSVALALLTLAICVACSSRLDRWPRLRRVVRNLAGYSLQAAEKRLARLAELEKEE
jgi:hypothetical protein